MTPRSRQLGEASVAVAAAICWLMVQDFFFKLRDRDRGGLALVRVLAICLFQRFGRERSFAKAKAKRLPKATDES